MGKAVLGGGIQTSELSYLAEGEQVLQLRQRIAGPSLPSGKALRGAGIGTYLHFEHSVFGPYARKR